MKSRTDPGTDRTAIYRLFDETGQLLYVGLTCQLARRLSSHELEKTWWADVAHISVEHYPTRDEAIDAESVAIRREGPRYNIVQPVGRPRRVASSDPEGLHTHPLRHARPTEENPASE